MSDLLKLFLKSTLTPAQTRAIYQRGWENGVPRLMEEHWESWVIKKEFKFMNGAYSDLGRKNQFHLLPLPHFSIEGEFRDVVERITGDKFQKGLPRKFGEKTVQYGTIFLNNAYQLFRIYQGQINIDRLMNLEHHRLITDDIGNSMAVMQVVRDSYTFERLFNLVAGAEVDWIKETARMIFDANVPDEAIREALPNKAKNFREIHDALSVALLKRQSTYQNKKLNQGISFLNGQKLLEYSIEVPSDSNDLIDTSHELKHCVHGYTNRILLKECQVLNLVLNNQRTHTIELRQTGSDFKVVQFKGKHNERRMEGQAGEIYTKRLLEMIREAA